MKDILKKGKQPLFGIAASYILAKYIEKRNKLINENKFRVPEPIDDKGSFLFNRSNDNRNLLNTIDPTIKKLTSKKVEIGSELYEKNNELILQINKLSSSFIKNTNDLYIDLFKINDYGLSEEDSKIIKGVIRELHYFTINGKDNFEINYDQFLNYLYDNINNTLLIAFKSNAKNYLYTVRSTLDDDYFIKMVNSIRLISEDYDFMMEIDPEVPSLNSSWFLEEVKIQDNTNLSTSEVSGSSNPESGIINNNNIDNSVIKDVDLSTLSESYDNITIQDLDSISRSDISSIIYEIYNIIINLDYNSINSYIDSLNLIKCVGIIVLLCTISIFLCWVNITTYLISGSLLEYYKIKEKYPKIYKYISISRKIRYYYIILEIIIMIILYIIILFICIDILLI